MWDVRPYNVVARPGMIVSPWGGGDCKVGISMSNVLQPFWVFGWFLTKCLACCRSAKIKSHGATQIDEQETNVFLHKDCYKSESWTHQKVHLTPKKCGKLKRPSPSHHHCCYGCDFNNHPQSWELFTEAYGARSFPQSLRTTEGEAEWVAGTADVSAGEKKKKKLGVSKPWGYPKKWTVYEGSNPSRNGWWFGGTPILGNLHLGDWFSKHMFCNVCSIHHPHYTTPIILAFSL